MPIAYRIFQELRLVIAEPTGVLTDNDLFGYQREVWSRSDVLGFNELVDMRQVVRVELLSANRIEQLARFSSQMDTPAVASKLAIVAPVDFHFALGRMYQAHRSLEPESTKKVAVFRSVDEALEFLGLQHDPRTIT